MNEQELKQQIIEKAWTDEEFKAQLIADPKKALNDAFGISIPDGFEIVVIEETGTKVALVIPENPSKSTNPPHNLQATW
ncbi:NHLP leader peptide family RiPP precursor [Paenibacillus sacheonensis]|uniref:NHLP leader peptide family natural product n=1 Tax=Paenibacillus sacheonensis TaxID=742054 RepID=A0A7X4YN28_9BACL|nr:NHLP leader peptide family RiPP precursor [Paenibacillus sacheonensis]MBM7564807.1 hypothetical protein [Paenibacillus sacheonensis]NBC69355.1 NHLP leader peptide family natural product precursor [Paenibacillus sacheonensis]